MSNQELIIESLAFLQNEEKQLLKKSSKSLGWIIDEGFTEETRSFVSLMSRLYEIYDDLEKEMIVENAKNMKEIVLVKNTKENLILSQDDAKKFSDYMKDMPPIHTMFNIPKMDLSNHVMRRRDD
ncbi:MAG: hypothetical protein PHF63_06915 [Herbinix sp.]|nr:hypothetical protein [Herbinix sp.]